MSFQNISSGILENSAAGWISDQILKWTIKYIARRQQNSWRILKEFKTNSKAVPRLRSEFVIPSEFFKTIDLFINCALLVKPLSLSGNNTHFLLVTTVTMVGFNKFFVQLIHYSCYSESTGWKTDKSHLCELVLAETKRQTSRTRNLLFNSVSRNSDATC